MLRKSLSLVIPVLASVALVPSTADATTLGGAPTLRTADGGRIQLKFAVDKKLPVKAGKVKTRISVNGDPVAQLKRYGKHGRDQVYTALAAVGGLQVGHKYTVRFHFADGTVVRQVKLLKSSY